MYVCNYVINNLRYIYRIQSKTKLPFIIIYQGSATTGNDSDGNDGVILWVVLAAVFMVVIIIVLVIIIRSV